MGAFKATKITIPSRLLVDLILSILVEVGTTPTMTITIPNHLLAELLLGNVAETTPTLTTRSTIPSRLIGGLILASVLEAVTTTMITSTPSHLLSGSVNEAVTTLMMTSTTPSHYLLADQLLGLLLDLRRTIRREETKAHIAMNMAMALEETVVLMA
jgi:hypothetical protein